MKITILTLGSRGDVQPYVALALGLQRAGHAVSLATGPSFEPMIRERGIEYRPITADIQALAESPEGKAMLSGGGNPLRAYRALEEVVMPMLRRSLDDAWAASQDAAAIVYHPKALAGYHIAEKLGIPEFLTGLAPLFTPTRAFPSPILPFATLGGAINRLSYPLALRLTAASVRGMVNRWRREVLGLPARSLLAGETERYGQPVPVLYGFSRHVVPPPADWPEHAHVTGYWFLDAGEWQPPADLAAFLAAGTPPVYVGFGSMSTAKAERQTRIVVDALTRARQRGIIATGWGGLSATSVPKDIHVIRAAPHDWLFARVSAVVHHGGAGTTASGLRAGKPTVICPLFGDQPFWGRRVQALGAGPAPVPLSRINASNLAEAIHQAATSTAMRGRAEAIGAQIRAENGVARAVEVFQGST
jgi:sterol 3beta-glucosyltransferase